MWRVLYHEHLEHAPEPAKPRQPDSTDSFELHRTARHERRRRVNTYEFTLRFTLHDPSRDPESFVDRLAAAGCDDATVGIGQRGRIALAFAREARSASQAILTALRDVKRAIPAARFVEAAPDFVGLTDVARILGCSRQNVRMVMIRWGVGFPPPVHEGNSALWRLAKVLSWAKSRGDAVDPQLFEVAQATQQVNLARDMRDAVPAIQAKVRTMVD